jgi:hypothetical protein
MLEGFRDCRSAVFVAAVADRLEEVVRFAEDGLDARAVGVIEGERSILTAMVGMMDDAARAALAEGQVERLGGPARYAERSPSPNPRFVG